MAYSDSLSKYFLSKNLLRVLAKIEPVKTPILSNLFTVSTGSILPQVKFEVYERANEVLPGVYPGNHATRRKTGATSKIIVKEGIELRVSDEITAAELNFFKEYDGRGLPETPLFCPWVDWNIPGEGLYIPPLLRTPFLPFPGGWFFTKRNRPAIF